MDTSPSASQLRLGQWARSGGLVGIVAALDGDTVTLFDPAERKQAIVGSDEVAAVPAGAVRVTATVELPLAHGLGEAAVRRWVASLLDEQLRERAVSALRDAGLDEGAALPQVRVDVAPVASGTVCLCGARTPSDADLACGTCGRQAVGPPRPER